MEFEPQADHNEHYTSFFWIEMEVRFWKKRADQLVAWIPTYITENLHYNEAHQANKS